MLRKLHPHEHPALWLNPVNPLPLARLDEVRKLKQTVMIFSGYPGNVSFEIKGIEQLG
ncbi:hypothetical protein D3C80_2136570 [compost metagenome]